MMTDYVMIKHRHPMMTLKQFFFPVLHQNDSFLNSFSTPSSKASSTKWRRSSRWLCVNCFALGLEESSGEISAWLDSILAFVFLCHFFFFFGELQLWKNISQERIDSLSCEQKHIKVQHFLLLTLILPVIGGIEKVISARTWLDYAYRSWTEVVFHIHTGCRGGQGRRNREI